MAGGSILWAAYRAAAANQLTTQMDSLADGNVCAVSSEYDNSSNKDTFGDFELTLASLTISSTSAFVALYLIPLIDTTYPDFSTGVAIANYHQQYWARNALVKNVSAAAARVHITRVELPVYKFKIALRNGTGVAFASSGNILTMRTYSGAYT